MAKRLIENHIATFLKEDGVNTNKPLRIGAATAAVAGGSLTAYLVFGSTDGFGIYFGSGAPSITAGQGSLYLRTDGSSTSTRLYVNTTGSTTWTNFTSAA